MMLGVTGILLFLLLHTIESVLCFQYQAPTIQRKRVQLTSSSIQPKYGKFDILTCSSPNSLSHGKLDHIKAAALHSSATDASEETIDNSKKQSLVQSYEYGQYAFSVAALIFLLIPDRTLTVKVTKKIAGAAGFGIAAGLSYILAGAASHNRLGSDTYKRLNIGLLGFCLLGLFAIPGESYFLSSTTLGNGLAAFIIVLKIAGAIIAYRGWKDGAKLSSWNDITKEARNGIIESVKSLKVISAKKAATYRNCLLLVLFGLISNIMEGIFCIRYKSAFRVPYTWFDISLQWSAVARLFMISTIILSLKDAAERDRLTGTTFIQLNIFVGTWAVLVALGHAIHAQGFAAYRGVEMFAFSFPFFIKALKSQLEKDQQKKTKEPQ